MCNDESDENSSGAERSEELGHANERIMEARKSHEEYLQQNAAMEKRHQNIQKRKWEGCGIVEENDSDFDCGEFDSDLSPEMKRRKTLYCKLPMQKIPFTPPRKHHTPLVSASDDLNAECGGSSDEDELYDQIRDLQSSPDAAVLDDPPKKLPVK